MNKIKLLILVLIITSCATRKTNVSKTENKIDTEVSAKETENKTTESKESAKVEENKNVVIETKEDNFEIVPIDQTKESIAVVNGKTYSLKNAKFTNSNKSILSKDNSKVISNYEKELKESQNREFKYLAIIKELKKGKEKQTERKISILDFWWVILVAFMVWLGWKNKDKLFS